MLALANNTTGHSNTATGFAALASNTTAANNTAMGFQALLNNSTGFGNTAVGFQALQNGSNAGSNTAIGATALIGNTTGGGNTAVGAGAISTNTTGASNTAIGIGALSSNTTGSENVALGFGAGSNITTATNVICIGSDGGNVNASCFIGNVRGVTTTNQDAVPVLIDSAGQLGTVSSSRRYKTDIETMDKASKAILSLKPVTFHYKSDNTRAAQFGLIAEEVAEVNPDLVVRDKNGEIYTVRYEAVNAMLLNEFLKEHKTVKEQRATITALTANDSKQESTIARLEKQVEVLTAAMQKVSAQLEVSKTAPQTVVNNH